MWLGGVAPLKEEPSPKSQIYVPGEPVVFVKLTAWGAQPEVGVPVNVGVGVGRIVMLWFVLSEQPATVF